MSIDNANPLPNASEGFRIVNERETNDFAFIHDANEIKYEIARYVACENIIVLWHFCSNWIRKFSRNIEKVYFKAFQKVEAFSYENVFFKFLPKLLWKIEKINNWKAFQKLVFEPKARINFEKASFFSWATKSFWFFNPHQFQITRSCNFTTVGDMFAEQPYAIAVQQGSHLQVIRFQTHFVIFELWIFLFCQDELSRVILELQKERFFEDLTAKYWNSSFKGSCLRNDDSEGITLESLGGVFIATLVGLGKLWVFESSSNPRELFWWISNIWSSLTFHSYCDVGSHRRSLLL